MIIKYINAFLEYLVWLLPIGIIALLRFKLTSKNGKINGIQSIVVSSILTGVSVTIKNFLILQSPLKLENAILIGNLCIFFSYLFILISIIQIKREITEKITIPKRIYFYSLLLLLPPFLALINKNYILALDLFIYYAIIVILLSSVGTIYLLIRERTFYRSLSLGFFSLSVSLDYLLKAFSSFYNISFLQELKFFSFLLRGISSTILFITFLKAVINASAKKEEEITISSSLNFINNFLRAGLIWTIIFSLVTFIAFSYFNKSIKELNNNFQYELTLNTKNIEDKFINLIEKISKELRSLGEDENIIFLNEKGKKALVSYYLRNDGIIASITRMNKEGKIIFTYPYTQNKGFPTFIYHEPLFYKGVFSGSLAVLFKDTPLLNIILKTESLRGEINLITDSKGNIIIASKKELLFKNVKDIIKEWGRVFLVRTPLKIAGNISYIYSIAPYKTFINEIIYKLSPMILFIILLILSIVTYMVHLTGVYYKEWEELKSIAINQYSSSLTLSDKLSRLVEFFSTTDIEQNTTEFYRRLLNYTLSIIKNAIGGIVVIKENNRFSIKAQVGDCDNELIEEILSHPTMIPNIIKAEDAKNYSLLHVPYIVDNNYYGALILFYSSQEYSTEDIEIAKSISNLVSAHIKNRLLTDSLKKAEEKIMYMISEFSKIDISLEDEEFFKGILNVGRSLIPHADAGSIIIKHGDYYKYEDSFGYNKEILHNIILNDDTIYKPKENKAHIVKDIVSFNNTLPSHLREQFNLAGSEKIKQTLVAPIFINNEYFGGIFFDSFSEKEVFKREDFKIAEALSKLSTAFIESKLAYDKLNKLQSFDKAGISLYRNITLSSKKDEIIKHVYEILKELYEDLDYVGILEKEKKDFKFHLYNGYYMDSTSFRNEEGIILKTLEDKVSQISDEEVSVYTNVTNFPIFYIRFNTIKKFEDEERAFFERYGRYVANLFQMVTSHQRAKELLLGYMLSITRAIESKDPYTKGHSERVTFLSLFIGEKLQLDKESLQKIMMAGLLHDVGKIGVPEEILNKKGKLTEEEFEIIVKEHPTIGEEIILPLDPEIARIVRHHHEKWDGTGYPDGLSGEDIPLLSRIIAIADVFDALTSDRPYRKAYELEKAIEIMMEESGKKLDPYITNIFISNISTNLIDSLKNIDIISISEKYFD
ncbi:MAG: hypothetical protein CBR30_06995 [Dictyoglomus sp. NZ13-RE01]|nr:MAG: hypothetical protein CBR30_06995 [Dictyoglomus sp. NZ13-RE01]